MKLLNKAQHNSVMKFIARNMVGSFQICFFRKSGFEKFSGSKKEFLWSFAIAVIYLILHFGLGALAAETIWPPENNILDEAEILVKYGVFLAVSYKLSEHSDCKEYYFKFIAISNWVYFIISSFVFALIILAAW